MRFKTALHAVATYLIISERLQSAPPSHVSVSIGHKFAPKCTQCGHPRRVERLSKKGERSWRCARCMSRWGVETVDSLRGEIQSTRRVGSNDDQLANLATISRMLSRLRLWERRALVAYVTEESMHAAYSALSRRYPHRKAGWTYAGTREEIRKAQGKLESMLSRADLLS